MGVEVFRVGDEVVRYGWRGTEIKSERRRVVGNRRSILPGRAHARIALVQLDNGETFEQATYGGFQYPRPERGRPAWLDFE